MPKNQAIKSLSRNVGGVPIGALILAGILVVVFIYKRGKSPSNSGASSVVNSPNSPTSVVTSMGHDVNQGLPANQQTPNEPGTAPIIGGQYNG